MAIIGSVFSSIYASELGDALAGTAVPADALAIAEESVGAAHEVAQQAGATAGPQAQELVSGAVDHAFIAGWHAGSWVSFGVVMIGALVAWRFLPARATVVADDASTLDGPELDAADAVRMRPVRR